jgi:hypothetical protein
MFNGFGLEAFDGNNFPCVGVASFEDCPHATLSDGSVEFIAFG